MGLTFEKVWAMFQETAQRIGRLGKRFGELAEHLVAPNITQTGDTVKIDTPKGFVPKIW
jgi:hypothetical protein